MYVCAGKRSLSLTFSLCATRYEYVYLYLCLYVLKAIFFLPPFSALDFANKNINKNELHPNVYMLYGYGSIFAPVFSHQNMA